MRPGLTPFPAGYTPVILYLTPGNTRSRTTERMYDETANRENEQRRAAQPRQILGQIWEISTLPWPVPPALKNARMPHSLPRCALHSH